MLKKKLLLSVVLVLIISCKKEETSKKISIQDTIKQSNTKIQAQKLQDESQIETVKAFLKWYKDYENKLYEFSTVKGRRIHS